MSGDFAKLGSLFQSFPRLRSRRRYSAKDLNAIYSIGALGEAQTPEEYSEAANSYHQLTGTYPDLPEDVTGLSVAFKELLCLLWAEKVLTLPYTFDMRHLWKKNPDLQKHTHGFIFDIAKGSENLERASRGWQYRTDWHSAGDVYFTEIWDAMPKMVDIHTEKANQKLSLTGWVKKFSTIYPGIVSPDQAFYLERYQMHLAIKRHHFGNASAHAMSYEQYIAHFVLTPEESKNIPSDDPNARRNEIRKINKSYGHKKGPGPKKHQTIRSRARSDLAQAVSGSTGEALLDELSKSVSAEDYILFVEIPRRGHDFEWISNDFYPSRTHVDIESRYSQWITLGKV
ncbi:Uncharacterized protein AC509_1861 [Pseudomonas amygdali pv. morsprunorum]|nr:Uncharacterized protein AC509_1861 [Pseudomonas amygdali pv. morsprunorum]